MTRVYVMLMAGMLCLCGCGSSSNEGSDDDWSDRGGSNGDWSSSSSLEGSWYNAEVDFTVVFYSDGTYAVFDGQSTDYSYYIDSGSYSTSGNVLTRTPLGGSSESATFTVSGDSLHIVYSYSNEWYTRL